MRIPLRSISWLLACSLSLPASAQVPAPSRPEPQRYTLANGLRVVLAVDPVLADLTVAVAYDVGNAHDPRDYKGLAHLLEHLTFRGSRHLKPHESDLILGNLGARYNAFTADTQTVYVTNLPTTGLETMLWLESERMAFALDGTDESALELEQRVVVNELSERDGFGQLMVNATRHALYGKDHPFSPPEDEPGDVMAVTLPGLQGFFQRTYRPDNATLVLSGNFDERAVRPLIDKYFGSVLNPTVARLTVRPAAPRMCRVHRVTLRHPYALGRRLSYVWSIAGRVSAQQRAELDVLMRILQRRVLDAAGLENLKSVDFDVTSHATHSLLTLHLDVQHEGEWKVVETLVDEAAGQLVNLTVPPEELGKLKLALRARATFNRTDGTSPALALAAGKDPSAERAATEALTPTQLRAAAWPLKDAPLVLRFEPSRSGGHGATVVDEDKDCR